MTFELWVGVGALVGLAVVWGIYKVRGGAAATYIATSVAVVLGAITAMLLGTRKRDPEPFPWADPNAPPTPTDAADTIQPVADTAHTIREEVAEEERAEVKDALDGLSPEEELAALGNTRRRRS